MKIHRILLDPAEGEQGGTPPVAPATTTPSTPVMAAKRPITAPSNAPKPPRELTQKEKDTPFKIEPNDPLFSNNTSVKSSELTNVTNVNDTTTAPIKPDVAPAVKAPDKEAPITPKAPTQPVVVAPKTGIEPIVPKGATTKEFDYTGYSDAEVQVLKQMSTSAKDFTIQLLKEKKELEKNKNGQFMQHPNAYTLDPQYSQLQEDVFYYNKETEYWREQLTKVKAGDTWSSIKGWTKDGQPIAGAAQEASGAAEEQIRLMLNRCYNATELKQNELKQFATNYKNRLSTDTKAINEERAKRFGWVADPKILDAKVEIEPGLSKSVKEIREDLISLFPPYMQHTQAVEVAADLFAALQIYGEENRQLKSGKSLAEEQVREVARAEPTSKAAPVIASNGNGRPGGPPKVFTLEGMPK